MKKLLVCLMAVIMVFGMTQVTVCAAEGKSVSVYVTIADKNGKLALTQEKITVTDVDNDGVLSINDALYAAHEAKYEGGATAGYGSSASAYGLSLTKLWGEANGGSYGYYVNNKSAMSLSDAVKDGDYINAYVITDLTAWSDTYCYFDVHTVESKTGKEISLTLSAASYDANWNPITVPVEGATVTVDGVATAYKTDKAGKVTIIIADKGTHIISATSATQTLVPPSCIATVVEAEVQTESASESETASESVPAGDKNNFMLFVALMAVSGLAIFAIRGKRNHEA